MSENKQEVNKDTEKKDWTWKIIAIILLLFCLGEGYYIFNQHQTIDENQSSFNVEKTRLTDSLKTMLLMYDSMQTDNVDMQAKIDSQKVNIENILAEAEKTHKNDAWTIYKLRKGLKRQQEISQHYIIQLDSVNQANQRLISEKKQVKEALNKERTTTQSLKKTNEGLSDKVKTASLLRLRDLEAFGIKIKSNKTGKRKPRANSVDAIKTCFTISENKVTQAGKKILYVRIMAPDGHVLSESGGTDIFSFNGVKGLYSIKKTIDYQNKKMDVCMSWNAEERGDFSSGEYIVSVYVDSTDIGRTKFTLK